MTEEIKPRILATYTNIPDQLRTSTKTIVPSATYAEDARRRVTDTQNGKRGRKFKVSVFEWDGPTSDLMNRPIDYPGIEKLSDLVERFSHDFGGVDKACLELPGSQPHFKFHFAGHVKGRARVAVTTWQMHTPSALVSLRGIAGKSTRPCDHLTVAGFMSAARTIGICKHPNGTVPPSWSADKAHILTILIVIAIGKTIYTSSKYSTGPIRVVWLNDPEAGTACVRGGLTAKPLELARLLSYISRIRDSYISEKQQWESHFSPPHP
jgi:hypothetical protein